MNQITLLFESQEDYQRYITEVFKPSMDKGELVPDSVTNAMVKDRLAQPDTNNGFLLDGYPRTLDQVKFLDSLLSKLNQKLNYVIELVVEKNLVIERLVKRAQEQNRIDDTKEVIAKRLEVYATETSPLLSEYKNRGLLVQIDGMGTVSEVESRIIKALNN